MQMSFLYKIFENENKINTTTTNILLKSTHVNSYYKWMTKIVMYENARLFCPKKKILTEKGWVTDPYFIMIIKGPIESNKTWVNWEINNDV